MREKSSTPLRCPICTKGRLVDLGPQTDRSKLKLIGPLRLDEADLIAKCPKCGEKIGIKLCESEFPFVSTLPCN